MQSVLEIDLHGKNQYQSRVAIDAALRRAPLSLLRVRLIHGCHGGTALRDMILDEYADHPKVRRVETRPDGGATDLILREY